MKVISMKKMARKMTPLLIKRKSHLQKLKHFGADWVPILILAACLFPAACGDSVSKTDNSGNANVKIEISEFDRQLNSLRTADFDYIFTFKRKDGEAFSSEDKKFLKKKTYRANRRGLTKDEKILFIGSNFEIDKKDLTSLKQRFEFEDFSKPSVKRKREDSDNDNATIKQ